MGLRKFGLCCTALAVVIVGGGSVLVRQARGEAAVAEPTTAPDIEIGTPSKYPTLITPLVEGGTLRDGHHGQPLLVEEFEFNPSTHEIGLAKDSPNEQRIYGHTRIDAASYAFDLNVFELLTSNREPIGKIVLTCANKKIIISYNYVVSPATDVLDEPAAIDPSTYCASVQFVKGDECNKPGTSVTVRRNADQPSALADGLISKINRKTDVMTWSVERGGAVVKTGSFGFPVVATGPDLVKYVIQLP
jgi:hypothetical protein